MKLLNLLRKFRNRKRNNSISQNVSVLKSENIEDIFNNHYKRNFWGSNESWSGKGSELNQTKYVIEAINDVIKSYNITSILDVPCGDFNWIRYSDVIKVDYLGGDIVESLIENNNKVFKNKSLKFQKLDITKDKLPKVDLIFVRDCLVHLSYDNIFEAFERIKESGSKYLLTTSFMGREINMDIKNGDWRPLNLQIEPFNYKKNIYIYSEMCSENDNIYRDKCLILYKIDDLY